MRDIYYTGIGSRKDGVHTKREFLHIMKKNFKKSCIDHNKGRNCKACREHSNKTLKHALTQYDYFLKHNKFRKSCKYDNNIRRLSKKCETCKKYKSDRKCNLPDYIDFSGAKIATPKNNKTKKNKK